LQSICMRRRLNKLKIKNKIIFIILISGLILSIMIGLSFGAVKISFKEIIAIFLGKGNEINRTILLNIRLPRVIEASIAGVGLSVAGTFFQGLFRNPMADPYVLGISSGAALGATVAIVVGLGLIGIGGFAFIFAIITIFTVYYLAKVGHKVSPTTMVLAGVAVSTFLSSIISLIMFLRNDELAKISSWTMGGFGNVGWLQVKFSVPIILIGVIIMYFFSRDLNVIMTGEEAAEHLGINTNAVKKIILVIGSIVTASAVSVGGVIGFVGLIIPHISRLIIGPDNRKLVPFSALLGGIFLCLADLAARTILSPAELPVGIITAAVGGPFFIYLLIKNKSKI
jgi:iron complex transport system permease protein